MPEFDACIGNPPYIRQELIEHKERWIKLAKSEYDLKNIKSTKRSYMFIT